MRALASVPRDPLKLARVEGVGNRGMCPLRSRFLAPTLAILLASPALAHALARPGQAPVVGMRFDVYDDTLRAMEALERGEVDLVLTYLDDYAEVKLLAPSADAVRVPSRLWAVDFPVACPGVYSPFDDPEVRRALADLILAMFVEEWAAGPSGMPSWQNETWEVNRLPMPLESPWWNLTASAANLTEWARTAPTVGEALARFNAAMEALAEKDPGLKRDQDGRWTFNGRPVRVEVCVNGGSLWDRRAEEENGTWPWTLAAWAPRDRGEELAERVEDLLRSLGFEADPSFRCGSVLTCPSPTLAEFAAELGEAAPLLLVLDPTPAHYLSRPSHTWHPLLFQHWGSRVLGWGAGASGGVNYTWLWKPILALQEGVD
ncbi:MAG: hypothetical protein QI223_01980, partial [Candidatus Korarchaeota archaeon]|nr:hypothetical protein [Candidatus Korarchaeota archaeon]